MSMFVSCERIENKDGRRLLAWMSAESCSFSYVPSCYFGTSVPLKLIAAKTLTATINLVLECSTSQ